MFENSQKISMSNPGQTRRKAPRTKVPVQVVGVMCRFAANGSSDAGSAGKLVSVRIELGGSIYRC